MKAEGSSQGAAIPRHEEIVDERLVRWYFYASLSFLGISMLGGLLMATQLTHWNPLGGIELLSAGTLADDSHQRRGIWFHRQRNAGYAALGRATVDIASGRQYGTILFYLSCLAGRCAEYGGGDRPWAPHCRHKAGLRIWRGNGTFQ